jgi:hypothetical protein
MICKNEHIPIFIFKNEGNYMYRLLFDKPNIQRYEYVDNIDIDNPDNVYDIDTDNTESDADTTESDTDTTDSDIDIDNQKYEIVDSLNPNGVSPLGNTRFHDDLFSMIIKPSNVRFYSIEYTNPMLETPIYLQLPQNVYMIKSQILSAVFIVRHLEYTIGENNFFNLDYKLNILDDNIQFFSLLSNQYIELYENEYKIKDIYESDHK